MKIIKKIVDINKAINNFNNCGFVPTMGGLHNGHISLINNSQKKCKKTIVSIFVNPNQFNNKFDYNNASKEGKNTNEPGLRFNQMLNGKFITLYNQEKTSKFINWVITGKKLSDTWNIHSPGKDSEYVMELELLKHQHKEKIYKEMGYFVIKNRGASFYDSPQRVIYKYVITDLLNGIKKEYTDSTGRTGAIPANLSTDKDGKWYENIKADKKMSLPSRQNCISKGFKEDGSEEVMALIVRGNLSEAESISFRVPKADSRVT